jgi:hypothetical protein
MKMFRAGTVAAVFSLYVSQLPTGQASDLVLSGLSNSTQKIAGKEYVLGLYRADRGMSGFVFTVHEGDYLRELKLFDGGVAPEIVANNGGILPKDLITLRYHLGANLLVTEYFRIKGVTVSILRGAQIVSNRGCIFPISKDMIVATNDVDHYHQSKETFKITGERISLLTQEKIAAKDLATVEHSCRKD